MVKVSPEITLRDTLGVMFEKRIRRVFIDKNYKKGIH